MALRCSNKSTHKKEGGVLVSKRRKFSWATATALAHENLHLLLREWGYDASMLQWVALERCLEAECFVKDILWKTSSENCSCTLLIFGQDCITQEQRCTFIITFLFLLIIICDLSLHTKAFTIIFLFTIFSQLWKNLRRCQVTKELIVSQLYTIV